MLLARLDPLARERPKPFGEVDFLSPGADRFARPRRSQDREFERAGGNPVFLAQLGHEGAEVGRGQRRMMLDTAGLRALRQQVIEMPAAAGRVLALAKAANGRSIEDARDFRRAPDSPSRA